MNPADSAFSWSSPTFGAPGHNVHIGMSVDDAHDADLYEADVAEHALCRVEQS